MELLVVVSDDIHWVALEAARKIGTVVPLPAHALHAPLNDEAKKWIEKIWDAAEGALGHARRVGVETARPFIEKVEALTVEAGKVLAKHAEDIRTAIAARLNKYVEGVIDSALQRVRPTMTIGGQELRVIRVILEQRLMFSGSLKASLEGICEFVAERELSLSVEYGTKD